MDRPLPAPAAAPSSHKLPFSHADLGTSEDVWALWVAALAPLDAPLGDRLIVVVAHPDDETLGCGGLIHAAHARGVPVDVVVATDGDASHPDSLTVTAGELGRRRRVEVADAIRRLHPQASVHPLGLPDGRMPEHESPVTARVGALLDAAGEGASVLTHWEHDGHPDHEAVRRATVAACRGAGATWWEVPIWWWHWGHPDPMRAGDPGIAPDDLEPARWRRVLLTEAQRRAKAEAVAVFVSQIAPLSDRPGDEVVLHERMLSHFARECEVFVEPGRTRP